ncbi:MAG TPA: hypothetical protein VM409_02630, partial [Chloroflexia bacterium]|nr:hypothetical protein [Chloroflexia bacterium]
AASLYALHDYFEEMERKSGRAPLLGYGGQVFNQYPHITKRLGGLYLGEDARQAVRKISEQLQNRV